MKVGRTLGVIIGVILVSFLGVRSAETEGSAPHEPCNDAMLVSHESTPPLPMRPGEQFTKWWRVRNIGSCDWSKDYRIVLESGLPLGNASPQMLNVIIKAKDEVSIRLVITAPLLRGRYETVWRLADPTGIPFGPELRTLIQVDSSRAFMPRTVGYGGGAGGGVACQSPSFRVARPTLVIAHSTSKSAIVCAYGLSAFAPYRATLRSPDGRVYTSSFYVGPQIEVRHEAGNFMTTYALVGLWWPDHEQPGVWELIVEGSSHRLAIPVQITDIAESNNYLIRLSPASPHSPFDVVFQDSFSPTPVLTIGHSMFVSGQGLPANDVVSVGLYRPTPSGEGVLVDSFPIKTDAAGQFLVEYPLSEHLPLGNLSVAVWHRELSSMVYVDPEEADPELLNTAVSSDFILTRSGPVPSTTIVAETADAIRVSLTNIGRGAPRGGSLVVSSPDVTALRILDSDAPIQAPNPANCGSDNPRAWVLGPRTACNRALLFDSDCRQTAALSYPVAESRIMPWQADFTEELTLAATPRPGLRQIRLYVRGMMFVGDSGCRMEITPRPEEAVVTDQQGFPAWLVTVPVP